MRSFVFVTVFALSVLASLAPATVSALGLKVAPLEYKATLKAAERKQGFIDVSNPSAQAVSLRVNVQAFKQIDNDGGLQFYDDEKIEAGIIPEIGSIELGPREASRLFFTIAADRLPKGDVYAALFLTTEPIQPSSGVGQSVRVGTILSIVNESSGERKAELTRLTAPFFQLSDSVSGTYAVKNIGNKNSGFYPEITISTWPGNETKKVESSLVFGGRERSNDFSVNVGYGIHNVEVGYGESKKSQWVIMVAPWMLILLLLVFVIVGIEIILLKKRRKDHHKKVIKKPASTPEE